MNDEGVPSKRSFDLEERTARFGKAAIRFLRTIPENSVTRPLIQQAVRSATSVGANYCEADDAGSKKEFKYRISMCKRETRETKHWLRMLATADPERKEECRKIWQEAKELHLIFATIFRNC
ncbi:four helix bundle protein [Blastopirellula retiformator]|nr:four helix bundle protein [Blastopirellula retiformator]